MGPMPTPWREAGVARWGVKVWEAKYTLVVDPSQTATWGRIVSRKENQEGTERAEANDVGGRGIRRETNSLYPQTINLSNSHLCNKRMIQPFWQM